MKSFHLIGIIFNLLFLANSVAHGYFEMDINIKKDNKLLQDGILQSHAKELKSGKYKFLNSINLKSKKKKRDFYQNKISSYRNIMITGRVYIGSNSQPFDLILDTGSGNTWLFSRVCESCNQWQPRYDDKSSSSFGFYPGLYDFHYGKGDVYSYDSFDKFCLAENQLCTSEKFSFFLVADVQNLDGLQAPGLIGLSPGHSFQDRGDRFILKLKESGAIKQKIFSFYIDFKEAKSQLTIGGINMEKYAKAGQDITYHPIDQRIASWWTLTLGGFSFGTSELDIENDAQPEYKQLIIDSGTTFLSMPMPFRSQVISLLKDYGLSCNQALVPRCTGCESVDRSKLPPLVFTINNKKYYIPWQNYILNDYYGTCYLKIVTGQNIWIMGLNFFENYYTVFDQENMQVGFALSKTASEEMVKLDQGSQD